MLAPVDGSSSSPAPLAAWLDDPPTRLRLWGTESVFALPDVGEVLIGTAPDCSLRLDGAKVMPRHAAVARDGAGWCVRALGGPGVRVDGTWCSSAPLAPACELRVGRQTLVAESARSIELRDFLGRLLGWAAHGERLDLALRALRAVAVRGAPLRLCGGEDLIPIARALHRRVLGDHRPFVLCAPPRRLARGQAFGTAMHAIAAAIRGTLCVWARHLPADFAVVDAAVRHPDVAVRLVVCAERPSESSAFASMPVIVPAIAERGAQLGRIIDGYVHDAMIALGARGELGPADRAWIARRAASSHGEIEEAARRLIAVRHAGDFARAAALLALPPAALTEWFARRAGFTRDVSTCH